LILRRGAGRRSLSHAQGVLPFIAELVITEKGRRHDRRRPDCDQYSLQRA
jgi:hypothetical protein